MRSSHQGVQGFDVGETLVVRTLRGSRAKRVLDLGLDSLSTYGLMKDASRENIKRLIDYLILR